MRGKTGVGRGVYEWVWGIIVGYLLLITNYFVILRLKVVTYAFAYTNKGGTKSALNCYKLNDLLTLLQVDL